MFAVHCHPMVLKEQIRLFFSKAGGTPALRERKAPASGVCLNLVSQPIRDQNWPHCEGRSTDRIMNTRADIVTNILYYLLHKHSTHETRNTAITY